LHLARSGRLLARLAESTTPVSIGTVGEVDPDVVAAFGLPHHRIGWLELDIASLAEAPRHSLLARAVSRYPSSDVDLAFAVDETVPAWRVEALLREAAGDLCESVELFDVYRGPGVEAGRRSLAFRVRYCALDHTLTESEIADVRRRCIEAVQTRLPATLRD
jgi:phenylalanyl-tRNA synthetase beta chain